MGHECLLIPTPKLEMETWNEFNLCWLENLWKEKIRYINSIDKLKAFKFTEDIWLDR